MTLQFLDSSLKLIYCQTSKGELRRAQDELRGLLKYEIIQVQSGFDEIMSEGEWQVLKTKVETGGNLCLLQNVCA